MPKRTRAQPEIADVVALAHALEADQGRTPAELAARERRLAPGLPTQGADPVALGLAWLDALCAQDESVRALHQRAESATHLTSLLLALAAIVLGWSAALGAFYFDGSGRVNAVWVLALLVLLPGLFIGPFILAALPARATERIPGGGVLAAVGRTLSAGRLAALLWRLFPRDWRDALALVSGRLGRHQHLYASWQKWTFLRWSQLLALTFQLAALVACLVLVVFTDLAFGWSTTLTTGDAAADARRVHAITSALARPWSWAIDDAQPSLALIEDSRYFRVAAGPVSPAEAARLGGWWRFVALMLVVYGVLPRAITFAVAHACWRAAARGALLAGPGFSAVLRRIHRAQIESAAVEPEASADALAAPAAEPPSTAVSRTAAALHTVINWSGVPVPTETLARIFAPAPVAEAGGAATVGDDLALAQRIAAGVGRDGGDVLILVKAWEPPLMEFIDFLGVLRGALSKGSTLIFVLPVGLGDDRELPAAAPAQLKVWRDKLATVRDPWLRVVTSREEALA